QDLDYGEKAMRFTIDQLLGKEWSLGARYQLTYASLVSAYPDLLAPVFTQNFEPHQHFQSVLHQIGLVATFNHHSGAFAQFEADWYSQSNHGFVPGQSGDNLWQLNLFAGYRFPHRRAEIGVGLLNLADTDYHLNPLTLYTELPRARTLVA